MYVKFQIRKYLPVYTSLELYVTAAVQVDLAQQQCKQQQWSSLGSRRVLALALSQTVTILHARLCCPRASCLHRCDAAGRAWPRLYHCCQESCLVLTSSLVCSAWSVGPACGRCMRQRMTRLYSSPKMAGIRKSGFVCRAGVTIEDVSAFCCARSLVGQPISDTVPSLPGSTNICSGLHHHY